MKSPNKETLHLWTQGNLDEKTLSIVEEWANKNPEMAEQAISEIEQNSTPIIPFSTLPKEMEIPYPDFFDAKLKQQIQRIEQEKNADSPQSKNQEQTSQQVAKKYSLFSRLKWFATPVLAAAMLGCFYLGTQFQTNTTNSAALTAQQPAPTIQLVYVPNDSVSAEIFSSEKGTAIVLDGLEPLDDDDITQQTSLQKHNSTQPVNKSNSSCFILNKVEEEVSIF